MTGTPAVDRQESINRLAERARQLNPTEKEQEADALRDLLSDDPNVIILVVQVGASPDSQLIEAINAPNREAQQAIIANAQRDEETA